MRPCTPRTRTPLARLTGPLLAAALALFGLAAPAPAATPATSSDTFPNGTVSAAYSDTDLSAGDAFTVTVTFTNTSALTQDFGYSFSADDSNSASVFVLDSCNGTASCDSPGGSFVRIRQFGIAAGASAGVTAHVHVNPAATAGTYDVFQSGTVGTSSRKDFTPSLDFTVQPPAAADLSVALAATAGPLLSSQISYTATVTNNGPGAATASTTTVALPARTASVTGLPAACTYSTGTRTVTCDTGALANGASTNASFTANLGLLSLGTLTATATRTSSAPADPNPANDSATSTCTVLTSLIVACP
ncbi:hypothetical protein ACFV6F_09010 [Kitasatospora phosalacinea]|uniref:hypothetical protein n=1 Tax=Kitasatospora phosalacinea TaxID=2065 RepID=UPI00365F04D5